MDETLARNILCVEDEPEMIDLIRLILSRKGFNVQGAAGGVDGIRLIRELRIAGDPRGRQYMRVLAGAARVVMKGFICAEGGTGGVDL